MPTDFSEKVKKFSSLDKQTLAKFYRAVLRAVQECAVETNGEQFRLLEGTVKKTKSGHYIFIPSKNLQMLLDDEGSSAMLKIEESRFLDILKQAISEL